MKVKVGRVELRVERGDLTEYEVDAIVNAGNSQLWMGAGVAGAIKRKGGVIIEEEAVRQGPVEVGEAVVTTAGNLPANYVIHAAVMGPDLVTDPATIGRATEASLKRAEELKLQSVAFPALGTGVGRVPPPKAARAMVEAIVKHLAEGTSGLRRILIVAFNDEVLNAFTEVIRERQQHPQSKM